MRAMRRSPTETRRSKFRHVVYLVLSEWAEQYLWFVAWNEAVCESLVMDLSMEQWLAIKFCFEAGKSATETLQMVNAAYGDQALSRSNVFQWYGRFHGGREDIEYDSRSGRPTECRNDNNVEKISQLLLQNRHLSLRMLADEVNIGKDTLRKIVLEDLQKWKICSRFIPHCLTPEQKDQRIAACRDLIATADSDSDFFKTIVNGDETWCFA